jgi:phage terminase large subunit
MSVADHDAGDRAILERGPYAIITRPAKKDDVDTGVQTVYEMLAQRRIRFVRDARVELDPALDAHELPTCTEDEMPMLHYPVDMDTALTKRKREGPVKENDHGHDALWYLMYTIRTAVKVEVVR